MCTTAKSFLSDSNSGSMNEMAFCISFVFFAFFDTNWLSFTLYVKLYGAPLYTKLMQHILKNSSKSMERNLKRKKYRRAKIQHSNEKCFFYFGQKIMCCTWWKFYIQTHQVWCLIRAWTRKTNIFFFHFAVSSWSNSNGKIKMFSVHFKVSLGEQQKMALIPVPQTHWTSTARTIHYTDTKWKVQLFRWTSLEFYLIILMLHYSNNFFSLFVFPALFEIKFGRLLQQQKLCWWTSNSQIPRTRCEMDLEAFVQCVIIKLKKFETHFAYNYDRNIIWIWILYTIYCI